MYALQSILPPVAVGESVPFLVANMACIARLSADRIAVRGHTFLAAEGGGAAGRCFADGSGQSAVGDLYTSDCVCAALDSRSGGTVAELITPPPRPAPAH